MTSIRKKWLLRKAVRTARHSQAASQKCQELSKASVRCSEALVRYSEAARHARESGSIFSWLWLRLHSQLMLNCAAWLLGRSTQLQGRARTELTKAQAIFDSLGIKRSA